MNNLGCVFIVGCIEPPLAVVSKWISEFVSGGSPNYSLQTLAVVLIDAQIEGRVLLTFNGSSCCRTN